MADITQPQTATLAQLIEDHRVTVERLEMACDALEQVEAVFAKAPARDCRVQLYHVSAHAIEGRMWLRSFVDDELIGPARKRVSKFIEKMDPEFHTQFEAFLTTTQNQLYSDIDDALEKFETIKADFGLTAAENERVAADDAESEALNAICRYRCANHDEERERLRYILECPSAMGCAGSFGELAPLILNSILQDNFAARDAA